MSDPFEVLPDEAREAPEEEGFPGFESPMLATLVDEAFSDPDWIYERKLDGVRLFAFCEDGEARLMTRNEKDRTATYPEIAEALEENCREGWEGLIAKQGSSTYVHSRSRHWLKLKCVNRQEFVIGGYTEPHGKRIGFGALLIGYYENGDLVYAGKVGTGYDDQTLEDLSDRLGSIERETPPFDRGDPGGRETHWVTPKLVCEVGFTEWTDGGKLRHPRYVGLRHDKKPEQVERERPS